MKRPGLDLAPGTKVGKLTLLQRDVRERVHPSGNVSRYAVWKCRCDCGTVRPAVRQDKIISGSSRSCGCDREKKHFLATRNLSKKSMT